MSTTLRNIAIALTALALSIGAAPADAQARHGGHRGGHGWHHHGHWGPGPFWGGLGIGIGLGYYGPWYPGYAVVDPWPYGGYDPAPALPQQPAQKPRPDPIFYPSQGQSPAQAERDRQDCNRWATTQPSALADADVFHRATLACMEGRGYTVR